MTQVGKVFENELRESLVIASGLKLLAIKQRLVQKSRVARVVQFGEVSFQKTERGACPYQRGRRDR